MTQNNDVANTSSVESKNYFTSTNAGIIVIGRLPVCSSLEATGE